MNILLAGSTGFVGQEVLKHLYNSLQITSIYCLVRNIKNTDIENDSKVEFIEINYDEFVIEANVLSKIDALVCCLGTTIKNAGSKEAFKKVDLEYTKELIQYAIKTKINQFHLISSLGANKDSKIFYNAIKGKAEDALLNSKIPNTYIYQPSILIGGKRKEVRWGERIGIVFMKLMSPFLIGTLAKYKPTSKQTLANSILKNITKAQETKNQILNNLNF